LVTYNVVDYNDGFLGLWERGCQINQITCQIITSCTKKIINVIIEHVKYNDILGFFSVTLVRVATLVNQLVMSTSNCDRKTDTKVCTMCLVDTATAGSWAGVGLVN
jgi:hypothetical protein